MKYLFSALPLLLCTILVSCNDKDSPEYPVFMQPSSFISQDSEGYDQTFEYDEYGRIVNWTLKSNNPDSRENDKADYSYPNDSTIVIKANYSYSDVDKYYEETIRLRNGRASKSDGIFIYKINGKLEAQKTYSLEYEYDPQNHLTVVKHMELYGIGDNISNIAWNKPWIWENYLIWEDGNLKEFQDYNGNSHVYYTTRYEYYDSEVEYPVIVPNVINNPHHFYLFVQGIFGSNSKNLFKSISQIDYHGNIWEHKYTYSFDDLSISEYVETVSYNDHSETTTYKVNWTEGFKLGY